MTNFANKQEEFLTKIWASFIQLQLSQPLDGLILMYYLKSRGVISEARFNEMRQRQNHHAYHILIDIFPLKRGSITHKLLDVDKWFGLS